MPWYFKPENVWILVSVLLSFASFGTVVLLWNVSGADPKWDAVAISLTVLEIFLAVVAVGGFWVLRGAAVSAAEKEARKVAEELLENIETKAETVARRTAFDYLSSTSEAANHNDSTTDSITDMMQALDNGKGGENEN